METGLHVLLVCKKNIDKMKNKFTFIPRNLPQRASLLFFDINASKHASKCKFQLSIVGFFFCTSSRAPAPDLNRSWPIREQRPIDPRPASLRYKFWTELISSLTGTVTPPIPVSTLNSLSANILTLTFNFLQIIILRIWFYFYIANW